MSSTDPLQDILAELASGKIDTAQAQERIAALGGKQDAKRVSAVEEGSTQDFYDQIINPEQARRADVPPEQPSAADAEPAQDEPGQVMADQQTDEQTEQECSAQTDTQSQQQHSYQHAQAGANQTQFKIDFDQVRNAADDIVTQAGGLARDAFGKISEFAKANLAGAKASDQDGAESADQPQTEAKIAKLSVRSVGRRVRVIADPLVDGLKVDGPHSLRRLAGGIEVRTEGELNLKFKPLAFLNRGQAKPAAGAFGQELLIRIHPDTVLHAEVTGAKLLTQQIRHLGQIRVTGGSAELSGVHQVEQALVQIGNANISGCIDQGHSAVRVESGNLTVRLAPESNVSVRADSQLGKVNYPDGLGGELTEYQIGAGAARLELSVTLGRAKVLVTQH